ncbi:MAG: ribosome recycling factor [Firmicutes bacterium]|nr:ribosome recycling factor [Bacillota bacterium]
MDYLNENINMLMLDLEEKLGERANHVKSEFSLIRAGRVNTGIVERVMVDYFGTPTPIKNLANISCADSRTVVINLWDTAIIRETSRALENANLGANPIDDGRIIRMIFPQLTAERRKELVKQVKQIAENGKVSMRNDRRAALDNLKKIVKEEKLSEDDQLLIEKDVQKLLDTYISSLDNLLSKKEVDILEV